jgi:hypothetical protein
MQTTAGRSARNTGEIGPRPDAARSRVGNPASTATKHGADSRPCCFGTCVSEYYCFFAIAARSSRSFAFTRRAFSGPMRTSAFWPDESADSSGSANS